MALGAIRATGGRRRAAVCRRFLPQHRLHAQQERSLGRAHRLSGPSRGAVRHNHRPGHDRHGEGAPAQARHGRSRDRYLPRAVQVERRRTGDGQWPIHGTEGARRPVERRRHATADRRQGLHQCRFACSDAERSRPRKSAAAHAYRGPGTGLRTLAPDRARRRLCRIGTGAGLSPLRQSGNRDRDGAPDHEPGGPGHRRGGAPHIE